MTFKFSVPHRNKPDSWHILDMDTNERVIVELKDPLFDGDLFSVSPQGTITILESPVRSRAIPAVLALEGSKTYGRDKKTNKLLYKCIPDDVRLPAFLVPYEVKHVGFSKVFSNMYVTMQFDHWVDKHPRAKLDSVLGPVDDVDCFYEYQLSCKGLNISIQKFQKEVHKANQPLFPLGIEDRTNRHVITIDPPQTLDYDDAFGFDETTGVLSVYIANVALCIDALQLWSVFSRRVATIYLPDKKRPMLPTILSDGICSLQQKQERMVLAMDVQLADGEIKDIRFATARIQVSRNYVYEENALLADPAYLHTLSIARRLSPTTILDSHDVVSYLMVMMNHQCALKLAQHQTGIFRSSNLREKVDLDETCLPKDVAKSIQLWKGASAQYTANVTARHELLEIDSYVHITSPIRRLVDLLNMIQFQNIVCGTPLLSEKASTFYSNWVQELAYINATMRAIRKVQADCFLLSMCCCAEERENEKEYEGYLFDKEERSDQQYQYTVFLPALKLYTYVTIALNIDNYTKRKCAVYLFHDEERLKRKIRVNILPLTTSA
jgi:exoribonuclease R